MPLVEDTEDYYIIECYGGPNAGKSYLLDSFALMIPEGSVKKYIVLFTNEPNWKKARDEIDALGHHGEFIVYFHSNLEEFENDIADFKERFGVKWVQNPKTKRKNRQIGKIREEVFAILVDEGEAIYRDGWLARHEEELKAKGKEMSQKDYGTPRKHFVAQMKSLAVFPCHFGLASHVGVEYREKHVKSAKGDKLWKTWVETGGETYRLPTHSEYLPDTRIYLTKKEVTTTNKNKLGEDIIERTYYGEFTKQKADRDNNLILRNPTMPIVHKNLQRISQLKIMRKQRGEVAKQEG